VRGLGVANHDPPAVLRHSAALSRDGETSWPLRTEFVENLAAPGIDVTYPEIRDQISRLTDECLTLFESLALSENRAFAHYIADVLRTLDLSQFGEAGRRPVPIVLKHDRLLTSGIRGWSSEDWEEFTARLVQSTSHIRTETTQRFRSTPIKAINSTEVVLPAGLPTMVTDFVALSIAQQLALRCLLIESSISRSALVDQLRREHLVDLDHNLDTVPDLYEGYFLYLSCDVGCIQPGMHQRKPGIHSDGLRDDELESGHNTPNSHGLLATSAVHTRYWDAPFEISDDIDLGVAGASREAALVPAMEAAATNGGVAYEPAEDRWAVHLSSGLQLHSATQANRQAQRVFMRSTWSCRVFNEFGKSSHNSLGGLDPMINPLLGRFEEYRD